MTSAINPRAIIFSSANNDPNFVAIGFARGEQVVEVVARNPQTNELSFFLVAFKQACSPKCTAGELLTPGVERNWTEVSIYEDRDLENTIFDCNQCHQSRSYTKIYVSLMCPNLGESRIDETSVG